MKPGKDSIYGGKANKEMPSVTTVGELKELIASMPDALPLTVDGEGYKPVWFNVGEKTEHLSMEPNDGTWD